MTSSHCLCDLVSRARRYRLSRAERVRLDEHLSVCESCRLEQTVGADFEAIGGLQPGDELLIARLAHAFERPSRRLRRSSRAGVRSVWAAVTAAIALVAVVAGANGVLGRAPFVKRDPPAVLDPSPPDPIEPPARRQWVVIRRPNGLPPVVADDPSSRLTPPVSRRASRPAQKPIDEGPQDDGVSSLFAKANSARRQNQVAAAIALYGEVERRFPSSDEARVSRLSLGRLLVERGIPAEGLSQLDDYLADSPDGSLAPEALFGKARALQALGRREDERGVWQHLLSRFPDSLYGAQARRRLDELR